MCFLFSLFVCVFLFVSNKKWFSGIFFLGGTFFFKGVLDTVYDISFGVGVCFSLRFTGARAVGWLFGFWICANRFLTV